MQDAIQTPYRIAVTLEKRREGDTTPYETIQSQSWHEPDGTEISDTARIAELEAAHRPEQE